MARLITKFKYLKPDERNHFGGYAEYIATREGVEKIDESKRNAPATNKQKQLIKKILSDFPDSKSSLEYEDYLKEKTVGAASEFITRMLEENADEMMHTTTYADYIATRPRVERFGSHGLFTDDGVAVDLKKVSDELNAHTGNVWTAIVSLRREDAERLGYDNGSRWRDMLRSQAQTLSENLRIPMSNLRWFAAFHNESYHPHIHLIAYSTNPNEGYLSEKGVMTLRSSFAKDIFAQDLLCEYKKQTEHRDTLKVQSREVLAELIAKINGGTYDNPQVEDLLQALARRLAVTNGKKQYGYLRKDIKEIINSIVDELGRDERIAALYDLWYESKETAHRVYSESRLERVPLSQNKEFKSVKNMVIAEAMKLNLPTDEIEETDESVEPDREPTTEEAESPDPPPPMDEYERTVADADKGNKWSQYRAAKFMLDRYGDHYDPKKAVEYLTRSAKQGYTVAKYIHFTAGQKEAARQTDLVALLQSQGEHLKRSGKEYVWRDGSEKVTVRGNLWFHQYERIGGDAVDFVRRFYNMDFPQAVNFLLGNNGVSLPKAEPVKQEPKKPFELPPQNENMRRVYAYLLNCRGIDREVLSAFVHKGMIYESADYHNAVFVGYDEHGIARHAHKRGTGSESTYKGNAESCDPCYSFHWTGTDNTLYLFEAPIDMLSFISLHKENWRSHSYAAACCVGDQVLFQMLKANPNIDTVCLCMDNDAAGQAANKRISDKLFIQGIKHEILVPTHKDWNEDLLYDEQEETECQTLQL